VFCDGINHCLALLNEQAATITSLTAELDIAKSVIVEANNSLYGSQGYFITTAKGEVVGAVGVTDPPDKYHLAKRIEEVKAHARKASRDTLAAIQPTDTE
jgi:hypothetical protein